MDSIAKGMPPLPIEDAERAEHTRLRRRLLYGKWREDLHKRRYQLFPHVRAEAQGPVDLSGNTFRASCTALAVLYEEPPLVVPPAGSLDAEGVAAAMDAGGYWELMIRGQRDCIGLREWMVRVDSVPDPSAPLGHALVYRPVYPDQVHAEAMPSSPDTLALIREPVLRNYRGNMQWTWDEWSIKDPSYPYYRVLDDALRDISAEVNADTAEGDAYRWRDEDGSPVLPYALYHAERTGYLWDPWEWVELVEGTLNVGVYWSFWGHVVRNASWPQRYAVGVRVPMDTVEDERANSGVLDRSRMAVRHRVVTDPSTVIMFESASEEAGGGQAMIGQWQPGADPQAMQDAISAYERRLANFAGLNPADFQRVDGDPRSGYAMKLTQDGQAKAQRRYLRSFRRGDLEAIRASAAVLARALDRPIPTRGYDVQHQIMQPEGQQAQPVAAPLDPNTPPPPSTESQEG